MNVSVLLILKFENDLTISIIIFLLLRTAHPKLSENPFPSKKKCPKLHDHLICSTNIKFDS